MEPTPDDEAAIYAIIAAEQEAWNRGDAVGYAARFHEEGSFTNILGEYYLGREAFTRRHALIFATIFKGSTLALHVRRLHFAVADAAMADIDTCVTGYAALPAGIPEPPDGVLRTRLLQAMVKTATGWWIAAYHNVAITLA